MRNLRLKSTSRRLLLVAGFAGLPFTSAVAHEGHHVECNQTAINALKADIQAMGEGEATTTATKEVEAAQQDDGQERHGGMQEPHPQRHGGHGEIDCPAGALEVLGR